MSAAAAIARAAVPAGTFRMLEGPAVFQAAEGRIEANGAALPAGTLCRVPAGATVFVRAETDAALSFPEGGESGLKAMDRGPLREDWQEALKALSDKRLVAVVGQEDAGRPFLVAYAANQLFAANRKVAVVDADFAGGDVAPAGCAGFQMLNDPLPFLWEAPLNGLFFGGDFSPERRPRAAAAAVAKFVRAAFARKADHVIVNMPGTLAVDPNDVFRSSLLQTLQPDLTVLVQRGVEAESAAAKLPAESVRRVRAASGPRAAEERRALREALARRHYADCRFLIVPFNFVRTEGTYFLSGTGLKKTSDKLLHLERLTNREGLFAVAKAPLSPDEVGSLESQHSAKPVRIVSPSFEKGLEVGLLGEDGETLALGIIETIDYVGRFFQIWSPLAVGKENRVKALRFGVRRRELDGREAGLAADEPFMRSDE